MANLETFGLKLYIGDGGSPASYAQIAGITQIPTLFSFDRSLIDISEIADTVKQYRAGQLDPGEVSFEFKFDPNESTHDDSTGLINAMLTRGAFGFVLLIPASDGAGAATTYMSFSGVVTGITPTGNQDDVTRATCTIKMSGQPLFSTTKPVGVP